MQEAQEDIEGKQLSGAGIGPEDELGACAGPGWGESQGQAGFRSEEAGARDKRRDEEGPAGRKEGKQPESCA